MVINRKIITFHFCKILALRLHIIMTTFLSCQRTKSADTGLFECKKIVFVRAENVLLIIVQIFIIYYVHHQKNIFQIRDEESFHKVCNLNIIFRSKEYSWRLQSSQMKLWLRLLMEKLSQTPSSRFLDTNQSKEVAKKGIFRKFCNGLL